MPPKPLIDLDSIDLETLEADMDDVRERNPQRYEFEQLDGILHYDADEQCVVGVKDVSDDEFWVRGHIPGRPLLPGVLMCEAAAQLCSYYYKRTTECESFVGFGGIDNVKFRAAVQPGSRLILVARVDRISRRHCVMDCQGFVDGRMVFEGTITGVIM
ncbi:MAG: 3-hydroxyacyl-ACP dehydratase FabZ family protein [Planctomycetota bacterium]